MSKAILTYHRHFCKYEHEADSVQEAARFADYLTEYGEGYPVKIVSCGITVWHHQSGEEVADLLAHPNTEGE